MHPAGPTTMPLRVLAHPDARLEDFAPRADIIFEMQGRTSHFTSYYATGLPNTSPGGIILLKSDPTWRTSWSIIAAANFSDRPFADLLFYDPGAGTGEFYATEGGNLSLIKANTGWRGSWSMVIACNLTGGRYSDLLFYDPGAGTGEMYSTDGHGNITLVASHTGWRTTWSIVKPCQISGGKFADLMFYDPGAGVGEFYSTDGHGQLTLLSSASDWRHSWAIISPANFTSGAGEDVLFYDRGAGTGEIYASRGNALSTAVLSTCEGDYAAMQDYFGGITPGSLPFLIYVQPGSDGAYHFGCSNTTLHCEASADDDPDLVRSLMVAEADEVFMASQNKGWDCGHSNGEGLSRVLATHRYPAELDGYATGPSWLTSNRPDFVTNTDGTDRNPVSIGCATLFIHYLKFQLGYSFERITQAGASTMAQVYKNLTGRTDAFAPFSGLLDRRFAAGTAAPLNTDNPWPIRRDLLFYDPVAGTGQFYASDIQGNISLISTDTGWRASWAIIQPGNFSGGSVNGLLFYDRGAGTGEFYTTDGHGQIQLLKSQTGWRTSWDMIIPGRFGDGNADGLLFYDRTAGTGEIYTTDGHGNITLLASYTNWRHSWTVILVGCFTRNRYPDLLFYDAAAGVIEIYATDRNGSITLVKHTPNLPGNWALGLTCNVTCGQFADVLFYSPVAGTLQPFATDGQGGLLPLTQTSTSTTWTEIHATAFTEFLFYDPAAGVGEYQRSDRAGTMTPLNRMTGWLSSWSIIAPGVYS